MEAHKNDLTDRMIAYELKENPILDKAALSILGRLDVLRKILKKRNFSQSEAVVLLALNRMGKPYRQTPSQLMESADLSSGAMTALLTRLEKKELILRSIDLSDRRSKFASLTQIGFKISEEIKSSRQINAEQMTSLFDDLEKRQLAQLLKKMILHLSSE